MGDNFAGLLQKLSMYLNQVYSYKAINHFGQDAVRDVPVRLKARARSQARATSGK